MALCDLQQTALDRGVETIGNNPQTYKDYHELLDRKDLDAVFVITPLYVHYPACAGRAVERPARLLRKVPGVQAG